MSDEKTFQVVLERDVRLFRGVGGRTLGHTSGVLTRGTRVLLFQPEEVTYDHHDQLAFRVHPGPKDNAFFILQEELKLPEFAARNLELKLKSTCAASDEQVSVGDELRERLRKAKEKFREDSSSMEPKVVGTCLFCSGDVIARHEMARVDVGSMQVGGSVPMVTIAACSKCKLLYDGAPPKMQELMDEKFPKTGDREDGL